MRTVRLKVYKFDELKPEAQKKAIQQFSDINVDYDWWNFIYADANSIGLKINEFDIDRGTIKGKLTNSLSECSNLIITNHGEQAETYKTAKAYLAEWAKLVAEHSDGINKDKVAEDKEYEFDQLADEQENQFRLSILEDYLIILRHEYEYQTSEAAIIESIKANEYEFTAEGKQYY